MSPAEFSRKQFVGVFGIGDVLPQGLAPHRPSRRREPP